MNQKTLTAQLFLFTGKAKLMIKLLTKHYPEYLMEAAGLGIFMISAGLFTVLFEYPNAVLHQMFPDEFVRRIFIGLAMGLTAIGIIYSPWGKQSGAHMNPAVTLTFFRLRKVSLTDTIFYIIFQTLGGTIGIYITALILSTMFTNKPVLYVVTIPGKDGTAMAFIAEAVISFVLMITILFFTNGKKLAKFTGMAAGVLLLLFIAFEAPLSGMSINPARSFASAFPSNLWTNFWIYLTAPTIGMLAAAEIYIRLKRRKNVICAKLHHHNDKRCIFLNCGYQTKKTMKNKLKKY